LNDPTYVEAARGFASRILKECAGDSTARLRWAFQQALQRDPEPEEQRLLASALQTRRAEYESNASHAADFLRVGLLPNDAGLNANELAAWTHIARIILNLHETITRS
jgi:hypothetical protein